MALSKSVKNTDFFITAPSNSDSLKFLQSRHIVIDQSFTLWNFGYVPLSRDHNDKVFDGLFWLNAAELPWQI